MIFTNCELDEPLVVVAVLELDDPEVHAAAVRPSAKSATIELRDAFLRGPPRAVWLSVFLTSFTFIPF